MREGSLISDFFDENLTADVCHILVEEDVYGYYNYLEEVLEKYGIKSSSITSIPQFTPVPTQSMKNLQSLSSALMTFFVG
ncbi:uncharacterized protein OCT59_029254 [Rhizophagus irregularis]|uniref:uncharacterized protein n=1 Tax=Rhizophagus irregularis TaxID=588596 RepID=UPI0033345519|nr:hypothetical protein OCT59_029254 [Rhizophagus irregularis]